MKKAIVVICILVCATVAFAKAVSIQAGFSILGMNGGASFRLSEKVKIGANVSGAVMANQVDPSSWLLGQGFVSIDVIGSTANDLDLRFGLTYLQTRSQDRMYYGDDPVVEETHLKFAGLTFGVQYSHWFGESRAHGLYVGIDFPVGGYTSYYAYGTVEEKGFFFGPLSSMATLALLGTSLRTGYCFQF